MPFGHNESGSARTLTSSAAYARNARAASRAAWSPPHVSADAAAAQKLVLAAARQIGASVASRGELSYSLANSDGSANSMRIASLHKYLQKLVAAKAKANAAKALQG